MDCYTWQIVKYFSYFPDEMKRTCVSLVPISFQKNKYISLY